MYREARFAVIVAVLAATACAGFQSCSSGAEVYVPIDPAQIDSIEDLQEYFHYNPSRDIIISAHRGGMQKGYPENCIASCEKTVSMMPTFFEIDFSFTKDSVLVLMHDLTLDRTTTGTGKVEDYTYEEIRQFRLKDRNGNVTEYTVPTLDELLKWGDHRVVFNFDNKYINTRGVSEDRKKAALDYYARQLKEGGAWAGYHNIMLSVRSLDEALFYWNQGIRNVMFCVEISSPQMYEAYESSGIPWKYLMAYIRLAVDPDMQEVYDKLHDNGVMTMTSITGSADKVKNPEDRRIAYYRELLAEPDIIETDYPSEFIGLPWDRATIHARQDAAIRGNRKSR